MPPGKAAAIAGLRVLAGVALYFLLVTLWLFAGLDEIYDSYVLAAAKALVPVLTHFPVGSSVGVELLDVHNRAFVLVWIVALALVVKDVPWKKRVVGYSSMVVAVVVLHVVGQALQLYLGLALRSQERLGVPLLLPWELHGLKVVTQALFLAGLQVAAFLALALTAFWSTAPGLAGWFGTGENEPPPAHARPSSASHGPPWIAVLAGAILVVATVSTAWWIREKDPRHATAHARIGDAFVGRQMLSQAEGQYRAALRGRAESGRTWMALASVVYRQEDEAETARVLDRALEVVTDPEWRTRLERARAEVPDR